MASTGAFLASAGCAAQSSGSGSSAAAAASQENPEREAGTASQENSEREAGTASREEPGAEAGSASQEKPEHEAGPSSHGAAGPAEAQQERDEQPTAAQPPADLADRMPYAGMPEAWIDATYMGPHDAAEASGTTTIYKWYSRNGKHDLIYGAYCKAGAVDHVAQFLSATDYWPGIAAKKPDFYAQGIPDSPVVDEKPDPADYDDEDDYISASEDWYRRHGADDTDAEATEDWDANANW